MAKSTQKANSKNSSGEQTKKVAEAKDEGAEQETQESPANDQTETKDSPVTTSVEVIEVELSQQIEASEDGFTIVTYGPGKSSLPPIAARHALSKNALEKVDIDKVENFLKIRGS